MSEQKSDPASTQVLTTDEAIKEKIEFAKYDSVVFYKDVNWVTFEGESKLNEGHKYYPFTAYCYNSQGTELKIFLSETNTVTRHIKKYKGYRYIQTKNFFNEYKDTVYNVTLFLNDTISLNFNGFGNRLIYHGKSEDDIYFKTVRFNIMPRKNVLRTLIYNQMYTEKVYSLDTLIKNIKMGNSLMDDYENCYETIVELRNENIYQLYDRSHEKNIGSESERKKEYLQIKNILGSSFFYFYTDIYGGEISVF